jgi:hypothetical protein
LLLLIKGRLYFYPHIDGLQPIPRDSNDKGLAAMVDDTNKRSKLENFINVIQHDGDDVT